MENETSSAWILIFEYTFVWFNIQVFLDKCVISQDLIVNHKPMLFRYGQTGCKTLIRKFAIFVLLQNLWTYLNLNLNETFVDANVHQSSTICNKKIVFLFYQWHPYMYKDIFTQKMIRHCFFIKFKSLLNLFLIQLRKKELSCYLSLSVAFRVLGLEEVFMQKNFYWKIKRYGTVGFFAKDVVEPVVFFSGIKKRDYWRNMVVD